MLFRRSKTEPVNVDATLDTRVGGKGRPTPTRRAAEAAARERARAVTDKKSAARIQRQRRHQQSAKTREGLRSGDERYLPARDQGPVKRYVRDYVDSRVSVAEFLLPLLVVVMVTQSFAPEFANGLWSATMILTVVDTLLMVLRLKRELRRRFPGESHSGTTSYAILRTLQTRFLRLPKPKVKIGGRPK